MKLQKLVYYSQAWNLVWDDEPLFGERIEAWANGPVAPDLYREHRGLFEIQAWKSGDSSRLSESQRESIDAVLKGYADREAFWLSELTHLEDPWKNARAGLRDGERGNAEISPAAMAEYYGSL